MATVRTLDAWLRGRAILARFGRNPWRLAALVVVLGGLGSLCLFLGRERRFLVLGTTSAGHRLMEGRCDACHRPWGQPPSTRCVECHRADLEHDHHAAAKFANVVRWGEVMERLDPRDCRSCHREHREAELGFTGAATLCAECHADLPETSASHRGFGFATCLVCHNYHYEAPIEPREAARHLGERDRFAPRRWLGPSQRHVAGAAAAVPADAPPALAAASPRALAAWQTSAHAAARINCSSCHLDGQRRWIERPKSADCAPCHEAESESFARGRHGMREATQGEPLAVRDPAVRLPMRQDAPEVMSCGACHGAHDLDLGRAQLDACLGCHADRHSLSYLTSPHGRAYAAGRKDAPTCASCHLPAHVAPGGRRVTLHNNSSTMRPPERMLAEMCTRCHGLGYAWAALRNRPLVEGNFSGPPARDPWVSRYLEMAAAQAERRTARRKTPR